MRIVARIVATMCNCLHSVAVLLVACSVLYHFPARCEEPNGYENGYIVKLVDEVARLPRTGGMELIAPKTYRVNDEYVLNEIVQRNDVQYIEPNYTVYLHNTIASPGASLVEADYGWNLGCRGQGVTVGVIDSGVKANHKDIESAILSGYNYADNNTNTNDTVGHGTRVSSIIVSKSDSTNAAGIAYNAQVIPIKAFKSTTTSADIVVKAIRGAVDDFGCRLINLSFGLPEDSSSVREAVEYAIGKNTIIVASVGNNGETTSSLSYPAAYNNVIGVGSVGTASDDKAVSSFSRKNESVFVVAPGYLIKSASLTGAHDSQSGTSFSAPAVTAMIAQMLTMDNDLTISETMELLESTAVDLGAPGYDVEYGYGLVSGSRLFAKMLEGQEFYVSPFLVADNAAVKIFNNTGQTAQVQSVFCSYGESKIDGMSYVPLSIPPYESREVGFEGDYVKLKHLLWDKFDNMRPLYDVREP